MDERRKFVRLGSRFMADYRVVGKNEAHHTLTRNLGGGGISLFAESKLDPGTMLTIDLAFPDRKKSVKFTAEVVWSGALLLENKGSQPREFEIGIRFVDISPEDQKAILQYTTLGSPPSTA